ncbi:Arf GTPase activating protein [Penicillium griseofulvum]|uniref:ADP-ribosylation factor GTPase-activating protein n=1 Tax=Penicillium patulum TaxID=5078 RepID=A0A135LQX5_PENPA|nr:Arf GTPase activating protein [Penicillium griseofulvum]KXG51366.1 Arf GTPase activating protein [Penicillium griseofulvum]
MGNVASRLDDAGNLFFKDQTRFSIASVTISNPRRRLLTLTPNAFPAARFIAKRDVGDDTPIEYIQDPDTPSAALTPTFMLRLSNDEELIFKFTFIIRQTQTGNAPNSVNGVSTTMPEVADTSLTGLTFAHASNSKELDNLITREFHANPNLQNNSNVQLIGDYSTGGSPSVSFEWSWRWKPPKATEDKGGGWRNSCSFLDYDQRTNRLNTLAHFSFWVHNSNRPLPSPQISSPNLELPTFPRSRISSTQSVLSYYSDAESTHPNPSTIPPDPAEMSLPPPPPPPSVPPPAPPAKVDLPHSRAGDEMSGVEDGPLFRATMKALESKTSNMRIKIKKVLKKAESAQLAQASCNEAMEAFIGSLNDASTSNANAIQPALDHYFEKIARQILNYEQLNTMQLQKLVIDPLVKLYNNDIKQAEAKKKEWDEESRDYYAYVSRYLGQRQDSLKEKKRAESDSKYQVKRRNFELRRFDYSSFMQDLHGGRKEQEVLSHLTKYASCQAKNFLLTAKNVEGMTPQLDALIHEVDQADKEFQFQRTEREEKRRALENGSNPYLEPDVVASATSVPTISPGIANGGPSNEVELGRADSTGSQLRGVISNTSSVSSQANAGSVASATGISAPTSNPTAVGTASQNRFKGIRDLEEQNNLGSDRSSGQQRKEGLLWALSRPGSHIDPKGINKQAWHKFWIVLDQGKLSEYSNWKQKLDLHMDPIDLRMASVREARNAERRFCFEVITPQFKRIYQATSEDDMSNWIRSINNALQSAVEGQETPPSSASRDDRPTSRDIGSVLTGKSSSVSGHHSYSSSSSGNNAGVIRRTTVGARPGYVRHDSNSFEENPAKLLQVVRDADQGNNWCADCGSSSKVEWVSINLGIILCIECSGIHRSLGTHISKIRSLTLDVHSFSNDIVEILLQIGNRVSNMIWEANLDQTLKPSASSTREQRLKFITAKYVDRAYVEHLPSPRSRFATPDETLLASIKKNDIQGVLYGLALRGNVNITDRSRNTHATFLALAAADPASPGSPPTTLAAKSSAKAIPFPIAELLVQNGAEIPPQPPSIPLSPAAKLYLSQRTARTSAFSVPPPPLGGKSSANDTLGSLPTIRSKDSSSSSNTPTLAESRDKDREKLSKRGSAGARFAGKVASLGIDR